MRQPFSFLKFKLKTMAELNVQPKKSTSILPWILLLLGIAALIWFLTRKKDDTTAAATTNSATATTTDSGNNQSTSDNTASADWNSVDFNAPAVNYDEVTDRNIS